MIEQLQMILTTVGDLGEFAVWAVVAFFLWKLATLASILVVIRFGIERLYLLFNNIVEKGDNKTYEISIDSLPLSGYEVQKKASVIKLHHALQHALSVHRMGIANEPEVDRLVEYINNYKK